jgi:hypothetical protein
VLGPWVNPRWLNLLAGLILGALLVLSGVLVVTTAFAHLHAGAVAIWLAVGLAAGALATGSWLRISQAKRGPTARPAPIPREERSTWRMPPLALLKPVTWSPGTKLGMIVLRGYLVVSVLLLIVKAIQLGGG